VPRATSPAAATPGSARLSRPRAAAVKHHPGWRSLRHSVVALPHHSHLIFRPAKWDPRAQLELPRLAVARDHVHLAAREPQRRPSGLQRCLRVFARVDAL